MTKKSSLLVDAVIVIGAHEHHYWELLCNHYQVVLPATIFEDEVFYFHSENSKKGLAPSQWLKEGKIERLEADIDDYNSLKSKLSPCFMSSLDPGELEALALLSSKSCKNHLFTTADRAAIKALGVLGLSERGRSFQELLAVAGAPTSKLNRLPQHYTKQWFKTCLCEGLMEKDLWLI